MDRGKIPLHHFVYYVVFENVRIIDIMQNKSLLHRIVGCPFWIEQTISQTLIEEKGVSAESNKKNAG
jgi:hypothetical protein